MSFQTFLCMTYLFRFYPFQELSFQIISFSGIVFSDYILLRNCLFRPGPFSKNIFSDHFLFRKSCFKKNKQSINEEISLILPYRKESAVYRPNFLDFRIHILYAIRHTACGSTTIIAICTQHGRRHWSMGVDKTTSLRSKSVRTTAGRPPNATSRRSTIVRNTIGLKRIQHSQVRLQVR